MALPETPLLDDFSRPDEDPLSKQGLWVATDPDLASVAIVDREAVSSNGSDALATWMGGPILIDSEAYVEVTNVDVSGTVYLGLRLTDPAGANTADGYLLGVDLGVMTIYRFTNTSFNSLGSRGFSYVVGDVVVFRAVGQSLVGYVVRGGTIAQVLRVVDTIGLFRQGRVGLGFFGPDRARNFGGGPLGVQGTPVYSPEISGFGGM